MSSAPTFKFYIAPLPFSAQTSTNSVKLASEIGSLKLTIQMNAVTPAIVGLLLAHIEQCTCFFCIDACLERPTMFAGQVPVHNRGDLTMIRSAALAVLGMAVLLGLSGRAFAGATNEPGTTGAVTSWSCQDYDQLKAVGMPVCLYIYTNNKRAEPQAEFLEGKDFLADPEVQKSLKRFHCVKMDVTRSTTIPKNFPRDLIEKFKAQKFAVVLISSDFSQQIFFKKGAIDAIEAQPKALIATAANIVAFEDKKKAVDAKNENKEKEKDVADAGPKTVGKVPGLADPNDKKDDDKKDGKKEPPKPAKPSKPAGPADE
jgi:hypothetical protein